MLKGIFLTVLQPENSSVNSFAEYPSVAGLFFRIVLSLIFILLIVSLVLKLLNKQQILRQNQKRWIKILDYQTLGANRGLYLLELYDLTCIVSVSDGQINILKEIDTQTEKLEEIQAELRQPEDLMTKGLGKLFNGRFPFKSHRPEKKPENEFHLQLVEQLRRTQHLSHDFKGRDKRE